MVQPADLRNRDYFPKRLDVAWYGRIFIQRQMQAGVIVVADVGVQHTAQRFLTEHDDVVEALSADGADDAFDASVLPRRSGCGREVMDTHRFELLVEIPSVNSVIIPEQISRCAVERERFHDLLCSPFRSGMRRHIEMKNASPIVGKHDKHIKDVEGNRGNG